MPYGWLMSDWLDPSVPVDFEGELQVTDLKRFTPILFNGIDPAKAFGCGLLLVRRCTLL